MKKLLVILFVALLGLSIEGAEAPRRNAQVDGKIYPVYQCFTEVKPLSTENPVYPREARNAGRGGEVLVGALVDTNGKVKSTFVARSTADRDIQHAVRMAVAQWRFPTIKEGDAAISYLVLVPVSMTP